ncbi:hypothetical protein Bphy_0563 [Paraburkholderia phymatum STM815]|uniref:Uncharacterized protein n=1 Tax=Paraburkholderia phymatum (strain DSM 17167 / CIP 108236 / LMG 21445 / STM815) TaxID=391038 RepID=B2JDX9_PARP8|nr:hypothetical protein Bphy_0563 [Paraburkholderia phymatum STM815]
MTALSQQTYSDAAEAAAAGAAFLCDFLCETFFVALCDEAAAAGAAEAASGAEACANAAVAKRPATRAAISLFILRILSFR